LAAICEEKENVSSVHGNGSMGGRWRDLSGRNHCADRQESSYPEGPEEDAPTIQIQGEIIMTKSTIEQPRIMSRAEWLTARKPHLANEKR
jgi:hypothetical protein